MKGDITWVTKGSEFRKKLLEGVDLVCGLVGDTMGPFGRNILIERKVHIVPIATNDGKRVAKAINPKDPVQRLAVRALTDAAEKTDLASGDGTTGTLVLAQAIIHEAFKRVGDFNNALNISSNSVNVVELRKQIEEAKETIVKHLEKSKKPIKTIEDLEWAAITSVEDVGLGKTIAAMIKKVGEDGHIFVEENFNGETETDFVEGMKFGGKLAANFMITNQNRMETEVKDAKIIVTNLTLKSTAEFLRQGGSVLGDISKSSRQVVIMAWKFEKQFLNEVANMWRNQGFQIICVKVPAILTEQLRDIAIFSGATLIDENLGMKLCDVALEDLGSVKKLVVNAEETILVGGAGKKDLIDRRVKEIKDQIKIEKIPEFKKKLEQRIADLVSGVGIIKIGNQTQLEQGYVLDKVVDAVLATKEAMRWGVVRGGGLALKEISEKLPKGNVLKEAILAPYKRIQENAGGHLEIPDSVIDPVSVIKNQLSNACSVAGVLITTNGSITESQDFALEDLKEEILKLADKITQRPMPIDPNGPDER